MAAVDLLRVGKRYGNVSVVQDTDIHIEDGKFVVFVGPSGCGKSTLLRMIAGLESVSDGEIRINDVVVNDIAPKNRDIAMVFQSYALYPHMTVEQNMGFSLKLSGHSAARIRQRVDDAASILNLAELLQRYPRELSGGQRQRVAMGRAIVRDPEVFLFDEPLSNLDAKLRVAMRAEIKELHQRLKTTTVYVTHDQVEAMTLADEIVVLNAGRVEQIGAPLDIYNRPRNLFTAGFLGSPSMNFVNGRMRDKEFLSDAGFKLQLNGESSNWDDQPVVYGIRPEQLSLSDAGIPVQVAVIEPTGGTTHVLVRHNELELVCVFDNEFQHSVGENIFLAPNLQSYHLFDPKTGLRVSGQ